MTVDSQKSFDILIAGGGPAGFGAAVAAARMGACVALVERHPILGGMGTAALVNNFCRAHLDGERLIIGGIFAELRQRLIERKALYQTDDQEPYDPVVFAEETRAMCEQAGVELFLERRITKSSVPHDAPARFELDDGTILTTRYIVDATGDAFIAAAAGVPFNFGRANDHAVMPLTYCYTTGPVDIERLQREIPALVQYDKAIGERYVMIGRHPQVDAWLAQARQSGEVTIQRDHIATITSIPRQPQFVTVNFGRVFIQDPTDPAQLARAETEGKRQVEEGIAFFRKYIPGFEKAKLVELARQIGVRESRHIIGLYTLTKEDLLAHRQFDDVIAQCRYPIDIHEPNSDRTTMHHFPRGKHYDIPWRCLVPHQGPPNLIVAGRSISATHEAASSFRVSPSVMAIGEAAGVTAAMAAKKNCGMREVNPSEVQSRLRATGGILE